MKNVITTTKRGRMRQIPNAPKPKIVFIKALPIFGEVNLYFFDGQYIRAKRGIPTIGCNELGTDINA